MASKVKIDAKDLTGVRLSVDGTRLALDLVDQNGDRVALSLPLACLNLMQRAVPGDMEPGNIHKLDNWSMRVADNGEDLLLTLRTPEAISISFLLRPWQIDGMATIATYGTPHGAPSGTVH